MYFPVTQFFTTLLEKHSQPKAAKMRIFPTLETLVRYKGLTGFGYNLIYLEDTKLVYGFNPQNDKFTFDLPQYPQFEKVFLKEFPRLTKTEESKYNFDNRVELSYEDFTVCALPAATATLGG